MADEYTIRCPRCKSRNIGAHGVRFGLQSITVVKCFDCSYQEVETTGTNGKPPASFELITGK